MSTLCDGVGVSVPSEVPAAAPEEPDAAPVPEPRPRSWGAVIGRIILVLASLLAIYLLVQRVDFADLWQRLRDTDPGWLAVALLASILPIVGSAAGFLAFAPGRLPFGQLTLVQLATSFVNLITPASAGGLALNVRYLTRRNIPLAVAMAVVGLVQTTAVLVTVVLVIVLLLVSGRSLSHTPNVPWILLLIVAAVVLLALVALRFWPRGQELAYRYVLKPFREAGPQLRNIVTDPRRLALAAAGHVTVTLGFVAVLGAALEAFDESAPLILLAVVVIAGSAIGGAAPAGGVGAAEAALFSGLSTIGVDPTAALSAAVLFRVITFWIRVPIGWLALIVLRRQGAV